MQSNIRSANRELISNRPAFGLMYGSTFLIFIFAICSWVIYEGQYSGVFPEKKYVLIGQGFIVLLFAVVHYHEITAMLSILKAIKGHGLKFHEGSLVLHRESDCAGLVYEAPPMVAIRQNYNFHSWAYRTNIMLSDPVEQLGKFAIMSRRGNLMGPFENCSFIGFDRYRLLESRSGYENIPHILMRFTRNESVYIFHAGISFSSGGEANIQSDGSIVCRLKDLNKFILLTSFRFLIIVAGVCIVLTEI